MELAGLLLLLGWVGAAAVIAARRVTTRAPGESTVQPVNYMVSDAPDPQPAPVNISWNYTPPPWASKWLPDLHAAEDKYGLPRNLLVKQCEEESNFDPTAVSPAGAVGLMQIIPRWHPTVDPLDPVASIYYAAKFDRDLYNRFGSWSLALAAYNWGPGNLSRAGSDRATWPAETRNYVAAITQAVGVA